MKKISFTLSPKGISTTSVEKASEGITELVGDMIGVEVSAFLPEMEDDTTVKKGHIERDDDKDFTQEQLDTLVAAKKVALPNYSAKKVSFHKYTGGRRRTIRRSRKGRLTTQKRRA